LVVQEVLTLVEEVLLLDLEVLWEWLELLDLEELLLLLSVVQTEVVGVVLLSVDQTEVVGVVFDSVVFLEVVLTSLVLLLSDAQGRATAKLLIISSL
jgi:hypothetical protein